MNGQAGCVFSKLAVTGKGVGRIVTNDSLVGRDRMSGEGRVARAVEPQCDVCKFGKLEPKEELLLVELIMIICFDDRRGGPVA